MDNHLLREIPVISIDWTSASTLRMETPFTVNYQAIAVVGKTLITRNFRRDAHHAAQRQLVLRGDVVDGRDQDSWG
jgi:hypothetical protein